MTSCRRRAAWAALLSGTVVGLVYCCSSARPSADQLAREIRRALDHDRPADASRLAREALNRFPGSAAVLMASADVEFSCGRVEEALAHLRSVADDGSSLSLDAVGSAGDLLFRLNRLSEAESCFRRVLRASPQNVAGQKRIALLLALSGRRNAAQAFFLQIIRGGQFDTRDLALLEEPERVFDNREFADRFSELSPADPAALLGVARYLLYKNKPASAAAIYRKCLSEYPGEIDVLAGYGRALLEIGAEAEFLRWHAALPQAADASAEIWDLRGRYAQTRSETDVALRCYGEALRCDPNLVPACTQLAVLVQRQGDTELALALQQRAERLRELKAVVDVILVDGSRVEYLMKAAELTESLGRLWEARGWSLAAATLTGRSDLRDRAERIAALLDERVPLTRVAANPVARIELSEFPRPTWDATTESGTGPSLHEPGVRVAFADVAARAGLEFIYFNGRSSGASGMRIFESNGGGVAALDYDGDLWPDLYFAQGCEWPPQPGQTRHLDRLYRNLGDGRCADVTVHSGLGDERYSQGVAAGDLDDDGFPDLYVANIGQNRLYVNNGDGTFSERTAAAALTGGGWTTSALIADLNGDGFPEIYDVTYLAGRLPFEHLCHDQQNRDIVRVCAPSVFPAETDRLFLNRGDGTFEDVSAESGIAVPDGKGLGIAAFDLDGSGRLSLYVANDTTPNFLFLNRTARPGDRPVFGEQARLSGCAVNAEGIAPASMGIAVDDADGDGLLDLFITTFYSEYDVLFRQEPGGLFFDATGPAGLKVPTVPMLGFGTQFLDGDLDGWPDLVIANGHVDNLHQFSIPYRMRGQYFANRGNGRFVELAAAQSGDYFRHEQLGRGMARLDWNRDGREDFAVSNLDSPAALVVNQTARTGHYLALQFRGVQSSRDAIGATVVVRVGNRRLVKQLIAGDGFEASNQRQLVFGLAASNSVDEVHIRWPSGLEQTFPRVAADAEYMLVEGRREPARLPAPADAAATEK